MGSRIMHVIIAHHIAEQLSLEDRSAFLFGSIAPDAVTTKNESHFFTGDHQDGSRSIDYRGFLYKYSRLTEHPYIWGYFTHLIADDLWLKGFYLSWLRNRMDANQEFYNLYHNDFRLLNGKLLEYYGITDDLRATLNGRSPLTVITEVAPSDVEAMLPDVLGDMEYDEHAIHETLQVFTLEQIIGYIETSIELGVLNMKQAALLYPNSMRKMQ
ncbi:zinc dependent phospholipase C family protein [Paenibacillus sp. SYP-B4298]|uniref:zinc dependent phospholipase C family protein n=1 Tax=Paenibacillus sp. SYP-B4298 TaxID=2996034 RepID=UPI0022DD325B|nr:zinc dependent phospholipase C family protein [Paenibacillus sp. SYP-B4298]